MRRGMQAQARGSRDRFSSTSTLERSGTTGVLRQPRLQEYEGRRRLVTANLLPLCAPITLVPIVDSAQSANNDVLDNFSMHIREPEVTACISEGEVLVVK